MIILTFGVLFSNSFLLIFFFFKRILEIKKKPQELKKKEYVEHKSHDDSENNSEITNVQNKCENENIILSLSMRIGNKEKEDFQKNKMEKFKSMKNDFQDISPQEYDMENSGFVSYHKRDKLNKTQF